MKLKYKDIEFRQLNFIRYTTSYYDLIYKFKKSLDSLNENNFITFSVDVREDNGWYLDFSTNKIKGSRIFELIKNHPHSENLLGEINEFIGKVFKYEDEMTIIDHNFLNEISYCKYPKHSFTYTESIIFLISSLVYIKSTNNELKHYFIFINNIYIPDNSFNILVKEIVSFLKENERIFIFVSIFKVFEKKDISYEISEEDRKYTKITSLETEKNELDFSQNVIEPYDLKELN